MIVCQLYTKEIEEYANISIKNVSSYCDKSGYSYRLLEDIRNFGRHPSWNRVPFLLNIMSSTKEDEWLAWIDVDILIMNFSLDLNQICSRKKEFDLIIGCQGFGRAFDNDFADCLNFGFFFMKNTEWSRNLLKDLWLWTKGEYEKFKRERWWDNDAINFFWKKNRNDFDKKVHVNYNIREFNSFYNIELGSSDIDENGIVWNRDSKTKSSKYDDGDLVCHFTDLKTKDRIRLMKDFARKVVK